MNTILENIEPEGFEKEKIRNIMYGTFDGIMAIIVPVITSGEYRITLSLNIEKSKHKKEFLEYLREAEQKCTFVDNIECSEKGTVVIHMGSKKGTDRANFTLLSQEIPKKCEEYQLNNCCGNCGKGDELTAATVDGIPVILCEDCLKKLENGGKQRVIVRF